MADKTRMVGPYTARWNYSIGGIMGNCGMRSISGFLGRRSH